MLQKLGASRSVTIGQCLGGTVEGSDRRQTSPHSSTRLGGGVNGANASLVRQIHSRTAEDTTTCELGSVSYSKATTRPPGNWSYYPILMLNSYWLLLVSLGVLLFNLIMIIIFNFKFDPTLIIWFDSLFDQGSIDLHIWISIVRILDPNLFNAKLWIL